MISSRDMISVLISACMGYCLGSSCGSMPTNRGIAALCKTWVACSACGELTTNIGELPFGYLQQHRPQPGQPVEVIV